MMALKENKHRSVTEEINLSTPSTPFKLIHYVQMRDNYIERSIKDV